MSTADFRAYHAAQRVRATRQRKGTLGVRRVHAPAETQASGADIEKWVDTRKAAKAAAQIALDEARQRAIAALAAKSRKDAKARGAPRYMGSPCKIHATAERYTNGGGCVMCVAERNGSLATPIKLRAKRGKLHRRSTVIRSRAWQF